MTSHARWSAGRQSWTFPHFEHDYEFVALRHETDYPMNEGRLVSSKGLDIAMDRFAEHFEEYQVPYSNAAPMPTKGRGQLLRRPAGAMEPERRSRGGRGRSSLPARRELRGPAATLT